MVSIQDVAKHAHVGAATVSRVLSGKGYVSEGTRKKVIASIRELNYVPNELARNLLYNKSNTIAVIVPDVSIPFFSMFVSEVEVNLRKHGYKVLLCNTTGEKTNEAIYLNMLDRNMVDGIITASHLLDKSQYASIARPIVSLDRVLASDIPMVCADHVSGGRAAAELLIQAGCRHVLQFRDSIDAMLKFMDCTNAQDADLRDFPFVQRHVEFERLIRQAGIQYDEYVMTWNTFGTAYFQKIVEDAFRRYPDVDGILATDMLALLYIRIALQNGKEIPKDVKAVAYDGTYLMNLCYPTVTTIVQPIKDIAREVVSLLLKRIEGEPIDDNRIVLPVTVVEGWSTPAAAK